MSGLKGNQKKGNDGKFVANPVSKPLRSLKDISSVPGLKDDWAASYGERAEANLKWGVDAEAEDLSAFNSIAYGTSKSGRVLVEWVDLGEGYSGDYDEEDPDDAPLLRFDAYIKARDEDFNSVHELDVDPDTGWGTRQNSSFCTGVPVDTDPRVLAEMARSMAEQLDDDLNSGGWKSTAEHLSYMDSSDAARISERLGFSSATGA